MEDKKPGEAQPTTGTPPQPGNTPPSTPPSGNPQPPSHTPTPPQTTSSTPSSSAPMAKNEPKPGGPTQPPPQQPQTPLPKKGFPKWLLIAGIIAIVASVAASVFLLLPKDNTQPTESSPTPTPQPTTASDPTANWQVYSDEENGFEFKYPLEWSTTQLDSALVIAPQEVINEIESAPGGFGGGKELVSTINITTEKNPILSDQFQEVTSNQVEINGKSITLHTITVLQDSTLGQEGEILYIAQIPFEKGVIEYELLDIQHLPTYEQILSTLTFPEDASIQPITPPEGATQCTLDAKICPDGSTVGRQGPNCEFSPCPPVTVE